MTQATIHTFDLMTRMTSALRLVCIGLFSLAWVAGSAHASDGDIEDLHLTSDCAICFSGTLSTDPEDLSQDVVSPTNALAVIVPTPNSAFIGKPAGKFFITRAPPSLIS